MRYSYYCKHCGSEWTEDLPMDERDRPTRLDCPDCGTRSVCKMVDAVPFKVKGPNATNGYSTHVGDAEKFMGRKFRPEEDA